MRFTTTASSGVNFTNILHKAFTCEDPKSTKNTVKPSVFFALLGSDGVKALRKMLVKSTLAQLFCSREVKVIKSILLKVNFHANNGDSTLLEIYMNEKKIF